MRSFGPVREMLPRALINAESEVGVKTDKPSESSQKEISSGCGKADRHGDTLAGSGWVSVPWVCGDWRTKGMVRAEWQVQTSGRETPSGLVRLEPRACEVGRTGNRLQRPTRLY